MPLPPSDPRAIHEIERLRGFKVRPAPDQTMTRLFDAQRREVRRIKKAVGGIGAIWTEVVPPALADRTALEAFARGTLTVRVADSGARYELDRFLRAGGERELVRRSAAPLRKIKVVL